MAKYTDPGITDAICHATCSTAYDLDAKAIITVTKSGFSARMISKYRPGCDIIGCAMDEKVCRQLNLSWGVLPNPSWRRMGSIRTLRTCNQCM